MDIEEKVIKDVISTVEDALLLEVAKKTEEEFISTLFRVLDDKTNKKN